MSSPLSQITDEMRAIFKEYYKNDSHSMEEMFIALKSRNVSPIKAMMLLVEELNIPLSEANRIVASSRAWNT